MMERLDHWYLRLFICFMLSLFIVFQSACGQEGFVSIQCCADSNFTDQNDINWITDGNTFLNVSHCQKISRPVQNDTSHAAVRIFGSEEGSKWCYNFMTTKDQDYLIRGSFLFYALQAIFEVLVGVTPIGVVNSSILGSTEVEGIFRANSNDYVNFCLLKDEGVPYISKLELRPLNDSEYLKREPSSVLKLIQRVDVGSSGMEIRYAFPPGKLFFYNVMIQ